MSKKKRHKPGVHVEGRLNPKFIVKYQIVQFHAKLQAPLRSTISWTRCRRRRGGLWASRVDYLANITGQFNIVYSSSWGCVIHHSQVPISSPGADQIDRRSLSRPSMPIGGGAESPTGLSWSAGVSIMMAIDDAWRPRRLLAACVVQRCRAALTDRRMMENRQSNTWTKLKDISSTFSFVFRSHAHTHCA